MYFHQNCPQPLHPYKQTLKEKILLLDVSVGFFFKDWFIKKGYINVKRPSSWVVPYVCEELTHPSELQTPSLNV